MQRTRVRELDPTCHNQRSHVLELRSRAAKLINFLKIITKSIYLLLAALGLRCREWACSSYCDGSYFLVVVHGLILRAASLVAERGLQTHRLPYFGAQPHLLCGVWDSLLPKLFSLKRVYIEIKAFSSPRPWATGRGDWLRRFFLSSTYFLHMAFVT